MDLISLLVVVIVIGVVLWLIQTYVPMPAPFKTLVMVILALVACVWLLQAAGIAHLGLR